MPKQIYDNTHGNVDMVVVRRHRFGGEDPQNVIIEPGKTLEVEPSHVHEYELIADGLAPVAPPVDGGPTPSND
jgi:hypothetical protein